MKELFKTEFAQFEQSMDAKISAKITALIEPVKTKIVELEVNMNQSQAKSDMII